jgi:drug/metabolite transporter (DMT)-like permease
VSWQQLAVLNAVLIGLATLVMRTQSTSKRTQSASFVLNVPIYVMLYLLGLVLLPRLGRVDSRVVDRYMWQFIAGGVAFALVNVTTYKMLSYIDAASGSILNTLSVLSTLLFAAIALHETLTVSQIIGSVIVILSIFLGVGFSRTKKYSVQTFGYPLFWAVITAVLFGFAAVNEKYLVSRMTLGSYVVYGWGAQFLAALAAALLLQPRKFVFLLEPTILRDSLTVGILRAVGGFCFLVAQTKTSNVGLLSVISNCRLFIVLLLGVWLLKEKDYLVAKALSACSAIIGLAFIFIH